ncbi:serine/threonine-protein kinase [Actinomycetospora straminea]|uniref:Protein kinase domain-containing protein n=1 Tax=Actinomycetospora straminea TaxID=663607 RepID=A0ABP9EC91_9PSEU|nr:serine/threonine-protein kinase [Actinomycetospora straminea]MDD7934479.1 serine/threonine-protein kinase [Actinomycetospora straminea]
MAAEGEVFGPYELRRLVGRGAMGEVWEAFDTRRERPVALKLLGGAVATDPQFRARFQQEARVTARLSSLHVIPIHDFGEIDGRLFVDMRLVDGGDLAAVVRAHPTGLPPARAVDIVGQIAEALDAAHDAGLVHRDVKPSNVLLTGQRAGDFCFLVDFGIARIAGAGSSHLTTSGTVLGTTAYMAPELFSGETATFRSDVYALACLFFELLTGHRPYAGPDPVAHMGQHVHQPVPAPSWSRADLAVFDRVVATGMAKDPAHRYPTPGALADAAVAAGRPGPGSAPVGATSALGAGRTGPPPSPPPARPAAPTRHGPPSSGWPAVDGARTGTVTGPVTAPSSASGSASVSGSGAAAASAAPAPAPSRAPDPTGVGATTPGGRPPPPALGAPAKRRPWRWLAVGLAALVIIAGSVVVADQVYDVLSPGSVPTAQAVAPPLQSPRWVELSADGRRAFVSGQAGDPTPSPSVAVVDTATNRLTGTVPVSTFPGDLAVSGDGTRLFVTERGSDAAPGSALAIIDTAAGSVSAQIELGTAAPSGLALSPDGRRVYVANEGTNAAPGSTVSVVDLATSSVIASVPVGQGPSGLAITPDGRKLYVANEGVLTGVGNTVSVVDTATNAVTATIPVGDTPRSIAVRPDGRYAYVASQGTQQAPQGSVSVVDTSTDTVTATITEGVGGPIGVAVTGDGRNVLVTNYGGDAAPGSTVTVINSRDDVIGTVPVGQLPFGVAASRDGTRAYVTSRAEFWQLDFPAR